MTIKALMSPREYAKHRGCALSTIQRAMKDERITEAVIPIEGGKFQISVKLADELWIKNTDPRRANNYKGGEKADELYDPNPKGSIEDSEGSDESKSTTSKGPSFQQHRAIREAYSARMAKLNFEKQSGKLLEVDKVKEYISKIHGRARDSLLNIPDKVGPKLAAETDIHKIIEMLNKEIQIVCEHFSKGEIDF